VKRLLFLLFIIQGVVMGAVVEKINIKGVDIPLIFEEDNSLPIVELQIVFTNGGSLGDGNLSGLSRLSAKLLNEGTKKLGSTKFAKKLEDKAIHFSVGSGVETLNLNISSLKSEFSYGVSCVKELLSEPNYSKSAFSKIKTITLSEISSKESDFDYIASRNLMKNLFENTELANQATKESINKIKLSDIQNFIQNSVVLSGVNVVIGGDINKSEAIDAVKNLLNVLNVGELKSKNEIVASSKSKFFEELKDTKQAYIYFGSPYKLKANDKDIYKSKVASFILGAGGFGSRLMEEVRVKRGLAYSAYSRVELNRTHSYFTGYLQTKIDKQNEAITIVKEVIKNFVENGVNENELTQAKKFLLGSEPLRNETLSQRLSRTYIEYYKNLPFGYFDEELKLIESLSLEDLNSFIKEHNEILDLTFSVVSAKK